MLQDQGVSIQINSTIAKHNVAELPALLDLFEDFCIVTASVTHGIPVHVSLKDQAERVA